MKITKTKSEVGTLDIRLEESENKHLDIVWGGNGDLYWIVDNLELLFSEEDPMYETFTITKADFGLYKLFEELYDDIMNARIFIPDLDPIIIDEETPDYLREEVEANNALIIERTKESNEQIKEEPRYQKLTKDGVITWYSDEEEPSITEIVRISKIEDAILLEFIRQSKKDDHGNTRMPGWYSIRFRTSGSMYTPCDLVFTRHFLNLQEYDPSTENQIHIEEYLYNQKLLLSKKDK